MNDPHTISIDEFLIGQPATLRVCAEDSVTIRKRRDARERYYTLAQVNRMMLDLHQLRSQRISAQLTHDRSCHDTLFRLALFGALARGEDGRRVLRVGAMAALLARSFGCPQSWCQRLYQAAPLHDVGLGMHAHTDPGRHDKQSIVKVGQALLGGSDEPALKLAAEIAMTWQERWDGNRPDIGRSPQPMIDTVHACTRAVQTQQAPGMTGLALDAIPLSGRIVGLIHYLDDLPGFRLHRVHNAGKATPLAEAGQITASLQTAADQGAWTQQIVSNEQLADRLRAESGRAFDPQLVEQLVAILPGMRQVRTLVDRQYKGYQAPDWGTGWWSAFVDPQDRSRLRA